MTFSTAKLEFAVRYYLWGESEFKKEIEESFPVLRSFKAGRFWKQYYFMQQLGRREQLILANALVKKSNPDAVQALNESFHSEEEALLTQLRKFSLNPAGLEAEVWTRQQRGEKIKFASKAKLRRAILNQFTKAFGSECINLVNVGLDPDLEFKMKCCGWTVDTSFEFNGVNRQITYCHQINSETAKESDGVPSVILGPPSLCGWLGIRGYADWKYLMDEDIQPVCDFVIKRCRYFFDIVPKLLKGLEFEKITGH